MYILNSFLGSCLIYVYTIRSLYSFNYKYKNIYFFFFLFQEELTQLKNITNSLAVFCMATYGEGDPTDNAMEFVEWLQNGEADLTGLNYTVYYFFYFSRIIFISLNLYLNLY